ncbi:MAG TPA: DUF3352 domain-containing protein [Pyrinomonadaceae bacterium]|nr:DUF3352 domain-containing protein [Pyrinomonadaceae bacterium]
MKVITRPIVAALLLLTLFTVMAVAQQKRQAPAKPQPKPPAAPVPAPTFDTLVPAERYSIYGEVRGVGQAIRSSAINDALEPILKLAGPPKEFKTMVKWLNAHAEELMTSRLLVASWPVSKDLPEAIVAIEFASAEEAAKFAGPLNTMLKGVIPPETQGSPETQSKTPPVTKPGYYLQQTGSLILLSPKPLTLKKLKPAGSKPLAEDINFRAARTRFSSEPIFVYIDVKLIERKEEEQRKQFETQRQEAEKQQKAVAEAQKPEETPTPQEPGEEEPSVVPERQAALVGTVYDAEGKEVPPDPVQMALWSMGSLFFESGQSKWPDGVAFGVIFENESIELRALLVNEPGEKSDTVPFMPMLIPGPPIIPEAANILPEDTQLFATMSLDLPQIYTAMSRPLPNSRVYRSQGDQQTVEEISNESPFAAIEKKLKMNLKDDVLPLLGSEVALRMPVTGLDILGLSRGPVAPGTITATPITASPVLLISLRDKDAVRALMPKIVEALGFKGASALAQTERKEDTEIVTYMNFFSYAFVGNFLVLSADSASVRYVVDSYLKHETLASESNFKNFTRWQPRPAHGQLYISPALMESYKAWVEQTKQLSDPTKAFLTQLTSAVAQPITYSLSNEGLGPLHELHVPKNLLLMAVTGISGGLKPSPERQNEAMAMGVMMMIPHAEESYQKTSGSYGTLEQLIAAKVISKEMIEGAGYKFEIFVTGDKFEAFGAPIEYGKNGKMSYFIDQTRVLRGADRNGASANSSDPVVF